MGGSLSHSPAEVIRYLLIDQGAGTLPTGGGDWPIFQATLPDTPDAAMLVSDTEGREDANLQVTGERTEHYGVQVLVRNASYVTGHAKANAVAVLFDETVRLDSVTIGSSVYIVYCVTRTGSVLYAGRSAASKRHSFTVNAVVALRQTV